FFIDKIAQLTFSRNTATSSYHDTTKEIKKGRSNSSICWSKANSIMIVDDFRSKERNRIYVTLLRRRQISEQIKWIRKDLGKQVVGKRGKSPSAVIARSHIQSERWGYD
ncbi:hypothetical protein AVEN_193855-1, partial [Araneus ventricosus]